VRMALPPWVPRMRRSPLAGPLDRSRPEQEVAPEDEPPHPGTGECRGRVLTDLAGCQRRVKDLRHHLVAGPEPVPAATTWRSETGEGGAEHPVTGRGEELDRQLPRQC